MLRRGDTAELYLVSQTPAAWVLGQKMLFAVQTRPQTGADSEPPTLEQLTEGASPELVRKALADKEVKKEVLIAIPGQLASPILRTADRDRWAASPAPLLRLLHLGRSPESQAFPLTDLSKQLDRSLRYVFETTLEKQLEANGLPAGVGCLKIRKTPYLFLLEELPNQLRETEPAPSPAPPLPAPAIVAEDFDRRFTEAFDRLNQQRGGVNQVSLVDLRRELGVERTRV